MEPYVALMRRYCVDYTTAHDPSVCDEIMSEDYEITISGRSLGMADYRRVVATTFRRFPTLMLTVHDMVLSGDRLAMRFSEHGALGTDGSQVAVWPGISLYRWDGERLLSCRVEQDFLGRDEQAASDTTRPLEAPHPDPWATTRDAPRAERAEKALRSWLDGAVADGGDLFAAPQVRLLETDTTPGPLLTGQRVVVDDLFSAGDRVAAALTVHGDYAGGLPGVADAARGAAGTLGATLLARVDGDEVVAVDLVRDRWGLVKRLNAAVRD